MKALKWTAIAFGILILLAIAGRVMETDEQAVQAQQEQAADAERRAELEKRFLGPGATEYRAKAEALEAQDSAPILDLTAFNWSDNHGYETAEGMVTNISAEPLRRVQAVAIFSDEAGGFITSGTAMIDYDPILPGQSSPFKVMARSNPAMKTCRVEFKRVRGGTIETRHSWKSQ